MRLAKNLVLTATFCACVVAALPAGAQQDVDPTHFPLATAAPPSRQHAAVAKKNKAGASSRSTSHPTHELKPIARRRTTATVKPAVIK